MRDTTNTPPKFPLEIAKLIVKDYNEVIEGVNIFFTPQVLLSGPIDKTWNNVERNNVWWYQCPGDFAISVLWRKYPDGNVDFWTQLNVWMEEGTPHYEEIGFKSVEIDAKGNLVAENSLIDRNNDVFQRYIERKAAMGTMGGELGGLLDL